MSWDGWSTGFSPLGGGGSLDITAGISLWQQGGSKGPLLGNVEKLTLKYTVQVHLYIFFYRMQGN